MIDRKKIYFKEDPTIEPKLFYIFCEGQRREANYFKFFADIIGTRISIKIIDNDGKSSPIGLYDNAHKNLLQESEDLIQDNAYQNLVADISSSSLKLADIDEVWFVIDTDRWRTQIPKLRVEIMKYSNWFVAQSNHCFEVWLYYHFKDVKPTITIPNWKAFLPTIITGGFNSTKHPKFIETAIKNAKANFYYGPSFPDVHETQVYELAEKILPFVKDDIDRLLTKNKHLKL